MSAIGPFEEFVDEPLRARWARVDRAFVRVRHAGLLAHSAPQAMHDDAALDAFLNGDGRDLGLVPNRLFDENWYLSHNPDVVGGVRDGIFASGYQHYSESGFRSRSPHWLFSERDYFSVNQDLSLDALDTQGFANGYDHFLQKGAQEGRCAHAFFDPMVFRSEVMFAHRPLDTESDLFVQYLDGLQSIRTSWYFDPAWYLDVYPQVAEAVARGEFEGPLHHYLTNETPQAFDPNPHFSEARYAALYPDVNAIVQGGGFRNGYEHFRLFGVREGREPGNVPDFPAYRAREDVVRDVALGRMPDGFAHFVASSLPSGGAFVGYAERHHASSSPVARRALAYRRAQSLLPLLARAPLDFRCFGPPALSVLITARNGFLWTIAALAALRESTRQPIEPIFIDDGSTDSTRHIEDLVDGIIVLRPDRRHTLAERLEMGRRHVRAPVVLLLDPSVQLRLGSVDAALGRIRTGAAAVTGRVTDLDLAILEAGITVFRDGNLERSGRGGRIDAAEIAFARPCDAGGSGAFFVAAEGLDRVGGIAAGARSFGAAVIDLSLALRQAGGRIAYDPAVLARSIEGANDGGEWAEADRLARRDRYRGFLRHQPAGAPYMSVRATVGPTRVLMLCDRVPMPERFGRSAALARRIALLQAAGCQVTVYPLDVAEMDPVAVGRVYGDDVEILAGAGTGGLAALLDARRQGFDRVWIAGKDVLAHCMHAFHLQAHALPTLGFVLDLGILESVEERGRRRLGGLHDHDALMAGLRQELGHAWFCQVLVVGSREEAELLHQAGFDKVRVLAHDAGVAGGGLQGEFAQRHGILCLPAIRRPGDAAHDGLDWFVHNIVPQLERRLPDDAIIGIGGDWPVDFDLSPLARHRRVRLLPRDARLDDLYRTYRILAVPDRFASLIPPEILSAASYGLPAVLNDEAADRLGWRQSGAALAGGTGDPARFVDALVELYSDADAWTDVRNAARTAMTQRFSTGAIVAELRGILAAAVDDSRPANDAPAPSRASFSSGSNQS